MPHLYEAQIQQIFVQAFNQLYTDKNALAEDYTAIIETLTDTEMLDKESASLQDECTVVAELLQKAIEENARTAQDQAAYQKRYDAMVERYETAKARLEKLAGEKQKRQTKRNTLQQFLWL